MTALQIGLILMFSLHSRDEVIPGCFTSNSEVHRCLRAEWCGLLCAFQCQCRRCPPQGPLLRTGTNSKPCSRELQVLGCYPGSGRELWKRDEKVACFSSLRKTHWCTWMHWMHLIHSTPFLIKHVWACGENVPVMWRWALSHSSCQTKRMQ